MDLITIDYETYYDKEFSLSKITTEEYIRDPRFEVIGVGVKVNNDKTQWFSGTMEETKTFLNQFNWGNSIMLAHNTMFDGAIHDWCFDIRPRAYFDTMCMARAIHGTEVSVSLANLSKRYGVGEKGTEVVNALGLRRECFPAKQLEAYAGYCIQDVELTYAIAKHMITVIPKIELRVIDLTLRMFIQPTLELDLLALESHLIDTKHYKEKLLADSGYTKKELMSNQKFADALVELGVTPPTKISPTTGKEAYAFAKSDKAFLNLAQHDDINVQALVNARLGNKSTLEESRTERFISIAKRGKLPAPIKYYAAHTSRWGGCLVADTKVIVYNTHLGVQEKNITDVLLDDLVWDGEEFVTHEGVQFSGYQEVITWDGVTGTTDHKVYTEEGEVSLSEAMQRKLPIKTPRSPTQDDVDRVI